MKILSLLTTLSISFSRAEDVWGLVWEDNFDGGNLKDRWNFEVNCDGGGNHELQCYTDNRLENCKQENGILKLIALKEDLGGGKPFSSTRMTTKANWLYGKFEIRARMPRGKHLWPAIWMLPVKSEYGGWPRSGEIDMVEYRGQRPNDMLGTLHFGAAWNDKNHIGYEKNFTTDFSRDFHRFGLVWNPGSITWLIDDAVVHTESLEKNFWSSTYTKYRQPFDKNFYLVINLAVGGGFFGGEPFVPHESNGWAKNYLEIDYVRVFEGSEVHASSRGSPNSQIYWNASGLFFCVIIKFLSQKF